MDSPINKSIGSSTVLEEDSTEYYCFFILASKSCCPKTHRRFLVLNHLDFQNHVSPLVEGGSLPSRSQSDLSNSGKTLISLFVDFLVGIRKLIVWKLQKLLWNLINLYIQAQISAQFQVRFVAWTSQLKFLELWEIIRKNSSRFCFLHHNPDCAKFPGTDFDTDLTWSSNSTICVAAV